MRPAATETTVFQEGGVTITNARAIFPNRTYAVAQISSVTAGKLKTSFGPAVLGVILVIVGLALFQVNILGALACIVIGGAITYFTVQPRYAVLLYTAGGEAQAWVSSDRAHIQRVVDAINQAIIMRG